MSPILLSDKVPYLLTILIGLAAWQLNTIVQLQTSTPTLAYRYTVTNSTVTEKGVEEELECELTNLSNGIAFRNLTIQAAYKTDLPDPKRVEDPVTVPVAPATILLDSLAKSEYHLMNEYKIPVIQPGMQYILQMSVLRNVNIQEFPKLYLDTPDTVRLTGPSFQVWLAKNQLSIHVALLAAWILFIITYLMFLSKKVIP
jgi:hypothetical protein